MSQENENLPVGEPTNAGGEVENVSTNSDVVDYGSFKKAVDEKKLYQNRLNETEKELQSLREADMKRKGKTDELLKSKEARIQELESKLDSTTKNFAWRTITNEFKETAKDLNCTKPDKLFQLLPDEDLKTISDNVDENFSVSKEVLKDVIERNKKDNIFLFSNSPKTVVPGNPGVRPPKDKEELDLSKMSLDEIKEMHSKLSRQ